MLTIFHHSLDLIQFGLQALAKNFGVSAQIVSEVNLKSASAGSAELEDLAVGSGGLSSGRDRDLTDTSPPKDVSCWISVNMQHISNPGYQANNTRIRNVAIWLPKDRDTAKEIVHIYFTQLNYHRPVLNRADFEQVLNLLYDNQTVTYDPGYVCSLYLVLALGTMSRLNTEAGNVKEDPARSPVTKKKQVTQEWPEHEEFFERALAVKPDLRVTISSLQALILLHWYLYTEVNKNLVVGV